MHMGIVAMPLIAIAGLVAPCQPQAAEEIIARSIEARGGAVALEARQTVKMTANVVRSVDGLEYSMTLYRKRPTFYRLEFQSADTRVIRATDGHDSWRVNPLADVLQPAPMPVAAAAAFVRQAHIDTSLQGLLPAGSRASFLGEAEVGGIEYLRVLIVHPDGSEVTNFYDAGTYLVGRTKRMERDEEGEHEVITLLSDYREVEGISYSFRSERLRDGRTVQITTWSAFEHNVEMDDSLFRMPR